MTITEIKSLPIPERIMLMEEIWDSLCNDQQSIDSPDWHEEIVKDRIKRLNANQTKLLTLQELKDRNR